MHAYSTVVLAFFASISAAKVSCEGKCGSNANGETCLGSQWGNCCSQEGFCGSTDAFCGSGCQNAFGLCNGAMCAAPSSTPQSSPDAYQEGYGHSDTQSSSVPKSFSTVIVSVVPYSAAPSYGAPSYAAPSYAAPSSPAASSSYAAPTYAAPPYGVPSNTTQPYGAPSYAAPSYGAPSYAAPSYNASSSPAAPSSPIPSSSAFSSTIPSSPVLSSIQASPSPTGPCNSGDDVLQVLNGPLKPQASSFCLAYLGGDKTIEQTSTQIISGPVRSVVVTEPDQTQQATVDVTVVNHITRTIISQEPVPTITQYVTVTASPKVIYQKRQGSSSLGASASVPAQLQPFESQRISSACSCIATPVTRTVQATQIQSIEGPVNTQTQPGQTVVVTVYQTIQVTTEETINQTLPPTATAVQTIATTLTPIIIRPKICNVRGLPGPNAFNYSANFNSNQADCIAACKADARCLATGFYQVTNPSTGAITGTCRYYDKPVADSANLGVGYYTFNDKAC